MGFDQSVVEKLVGTLGPWDNDAVPESLNDLLPKEVIFPLMDRGRTMPYDHQVHLLVRELANRLGEDGRYHDEVIKHCGHVLVDLYHDDDKDAAGRLFLEQMTLLADAYTCGNPADIIGTCWRGELARWAGDEDLALECAREVWVRAIFASAGTIQRVTAFFALTGGSACIWDRGMWDSLPSAGSHLGELADTWIDRDQPLAWAIVRRAFQRDAWDTSLLCSMMALRDNGYWPESGDAPAACWSWLAEHVQGTRFGSESYYMYRNDAFESLVEATDPALAHNVIVATLAGLVFKKHQGYISASIQRVLEALRGLHRRHPMPEKERAALDTVSYFLRTVKLEHLTAADRLAIEASVPRLEALRQQDAASSTTEPNAPQSPLERAGPPHLAHAEACVRSLLGEALWARLSRTARDKFKEGELLYWAVSEADGERGDFDGFVMPYSRGLLAEIQESIRGPLVKDPSLRKEFRDQFGGKDDPEWARSSDMWTSSRQTPRRDLAGRSRCRESGWIAWNRCGSLWRR